MKKHLRAILTVIVLVVFVAYFFLNVDDFKPLLHIDAWLLILIALGDLAGIAANGLFIKFVLRPFEKFISVSESIYVALISSVGNFFAPAGSGFGFRAIYLKKRHGLAYSDYVATLYGNYVIVFLVNSFFALLALYLLRSRQSSVYLTLVVVFGGIFGVSLLLSLVKVPQISLGKVIKNKYLNLLSKILLQMVEGWNRIISSKTLMVHLISLVAFNFLLSMGVAKTEIVALHFSISFPALLLFSVLGSLSLFVSITPANLGVKEAIYIFSAHVIGLSTPQILSIALIDRGVLFVVLVVLWLYSSRAKGGSGVDLAT